MIFVHKINRFHQYLPEIIMTDNRKAQTIFKTILIDLKHLDLSFQAISNTTEPVGLSWSFMGDFTQIWHSLVRITTTTIHNVYLNVHFFFCFVTICVNRNTRKKSIGPLVYFWKYR